MVSPQSIHEQFFSVGRTKSTETTMGNRDGVRLGDGGHRSGTVPEDYEGLVGCHIRCRPGPKTRIFYQPNSSTVIRPYHRLRDGGDTTLTKSVREFLDFKIT